METRTRRVVPIGRGAFRADLANGQLHLQQGPINLIVGAVGSAKKKTDAYDRAEARFCGLLEGLVEELDVLRDPICTDQVMPVSGLVAQRMWSAASAYASEDFITPMVAVAGAVADAVIEAMWGHGDLKRAWVNNGGDIAVRLSEGESIKIGVVPTLRDAVQCADLTLDFRDRARGIATSGWDGHSYSLGVADAVTVLADTAAIADAGATMVANRVNVEHPHIVRASAQELAHDSDLGDARVTVRVPRLPMELKSQALDAGARYARRLCGLGRITAAFLVLQGDSRVVGQPYLNKSGRMNDK